MACAGAGDPSHRSACEARDTVLEQGALFVTTDYVMDETLTLIRMRLGLPAAYVNFAPLRTPRRGSIGAGQW